MAGYFWMKDRWTGSMKGLSLFDNKERSLYIETRDNKAEWSHIDLSVPAVHILYCTSYYGVLRLVSMLIITVLLEHYAACTWRIQPTPEL